MVTVELLIEKVNQSPASLILLHINVHMAISPLTTISSLQSQKCTMLSTLNLIELKMTCHRSRDYSISCEPPFARISLVTRAIKMQRATQAAYPPAHTGKSLGERHAPTVMSEYAEYLVARDG